MVEKIYYNFYGKVVINGLSYTVSTAYSLGRVRRTNIFTTEKCKYWSEKVPAVGNIYSVSIISASFTGYTRKSHTGGYFSHSSFTRDLFDVTLFIKNHGAYGPSTRYGVGGNIGLFLPEGIWTFLQAEIDEHNSDGEIRGDSGNPLDDKMFKI